MKYCSKIVQIFQNVPLPKTPAFNPEYLTAKGVPKVSGKGVEDTTAGAAFATQGSAVTTEAPLIAGPRVTALNPSTTGFPAMKPFDPKIPLENR